MQPHALTETPAGMNTIYWETFHVVAQKVCIEFSRVINIDKPCDTCAKMLQAMNIISNDYVWDLGVWDMLLIGC